ncbi:hypothetical protein C8T65DRAFT_162179 [Cerioporus squamosus]|nr:hypothetical protein C8T65DRAFT_162179 [Cerioporus squamosus]
MLSHHRRQPQMDAAPSVLFHFAAHPSPPSHHQPLHFSYFPDRLPDRRTPASHSSFVRASAPRQMQPFASQFLPSSFRSTYSMNSSSSGSASFGVDPSPMGSPYEVSEADLRNATVTSSGSQQYPSEQYSQSWSQVGEQSHSQYADSYSPPSYDLPPPAAASTSADGAYAHSSVKAEEHMESYTAGMYLPPYADHLQSPNHLPEQQQHSPSFSYSLPQYHSGSPAQQPMTYAYSHDGQPHASGSSEVANMSSYMLAAPAAQLQYPDYAADSEVPRYVHPAQVSPAISPSSPFAQLQDIPQGQSLDPRFTMNDPMQTALGGGGGGGGPSPSEDFDFDSGGSVSGGDSPFIPGASAPIPVPAGGSERKRQRSVSFTSSEEDDFSAGSGGDSEHDDDYDDGEFVQGSSSSRSRRRHGQGDGEFMPGMGSPSTSIGSGSMSVGGRRLAPPVPVPNLTKKSRGRRVPTAQQVVSEGAVQKRGYMCKVPGCGKCFARGEHLKRHVRSIHTNEKPHKCPYPGCGKDFSRHDNLGQHMRVHKGFTAPKAGRA